MSRKLAPEGEVAAWSSVGRWLAGVSGIGIVITSSLVVASYAIFEGNPADCKVRQLAADAIQGGFHFSLFFLISGVASLTAVIAPAVARALHFLRRTKKDKSMPMPADWQPTTFITDVQFGAIIVAFFVAGLCMYLLLLKASGLNIAGLNSLSDSLNRICQAPRTADNRLASP